MRHPYYRQTQWLDDKKATKRKVAWREALGWYNHHKNLDLDVAIVERVSDKTAELQYAVYVFGIEAGEATNYDPNTETISGTIVECTDNFIERAESWYKSVKVKGEDIPSFLGAA